MAWSISGARSSERARDARHVGRRAKGEVVSAFDVGALIAELDAIGEEIIGILERHPVVQTWLAGRPDRARVFAFQAQLYHQVARTVPELEGCARTCARLAADEPMYGVLARHFARHAAAESEPAPHDVLLREDLRHQGFPVNRLPPPSPPVQRYLARGRWAVQHAPLQEIGRAYVLEALGQRLAPRAVGALPCRAGDEAPADTFYQVHADADCPGQGHVEQDRAILRELSSFPAFAARARATCSRALATSASTSRPCGPTWTRRPPRPLRAHASAHEGGAGVLVSSGLSGRLIVTQVPGPSVLRTSTWPRWRKVVS